ncbi:TPA: hypothetical protein ACXDAZ_003165 [Clostridium botulinum]|uniref:hypothetical protein n=1 Tax=Clostridium botulinum TaxID=1491 RepID=UPI0008FCCBB3|nr:hypothetical protein [Clostridium botulinum]APC79933.1 hypothetical protein NPD2_824 [Clostridium botulinum]APU61298.1 hypothetical protein NPD8_3257 [Clostridium botulinum]MCS4447339.1 hypothetical protein [Clostridium botulinum]MCS4456728.1 hypothetical protein [Clostridium botulinum]MCS4460503.1 hypothetical protein [Clostridium botulinum]
MRKKVSERNVLPDTDLFNEYQKLEFLFSENKCIGQFDMFGRRKWIPEFTLEQYLNDLAFSDWNLKGTAISFYNMRDELGLNKEKISADFSTDIFVDFIELCLNCVFRIDKTIDKHSGVAYISDRNLLRNIFNNCISILERLNYTYEFEKETNEIYVYDENNVATAVAERNDDISNSIIEYRRHDMKGDLKRKGEILCTLFKKLESVEKKFKGTTYERLASDTTFLFNKTGIRHWVEQDKIASETFMRMDLDILEKWYDNTYDLFLSCMVISSYLDMKKEIEEIKRGNGE